MNRQVVWQAFDMHGATNDFNDDIEDVDADDDEDEVTVSLISKLRNTPMGIVPDIKKTIFKKYPLWVGHTNFKLTAREYTIISDTLGVESLVFISPYRFVVGFGELFQSAKVKVDISRQLCKVLSKTVLDIKTVAEAHNEPLGDEHNSTFAEFVSKTKEYSYVAMYIIPNGEVDWVFTNDQTEFENKVNDYFTAYQLVGGYLKIE